LFVNKSCLKVKTYFKAQSNLHNVMRMSCHARIRTHICAYKHIQTHT
jgi:hypothetical protein